MSKKRRTKKQKLAATSRHNFSAVLNLTESRVKVAIEAPMLEASPVVKQAPGLQKLSSYSYVGRDIRNTLGITSILIALNIFFYFILKLKLISLFGIVF